MTRVCDFGGGRVGFRESLSSRGGVGGGGGGLAAAMRLLDDAVKLVQTAIGARVAAAHDITAHLAVAAREAGLRGPSLRGTVAIATVPRRALLASGLARAGSIVCIRIRGWRYHCVQAESEGVRRRLGR